MQLAYLAYSAITSKFWPFSEDFDGLLDHNDALVTMPNFCIETNVPERAVDLDNFSSELASAIASSLGKPLSYVMVAVKPGVCLTFGEAAGKSGIQDR